MSLNLKQIVGAATLTICTIVASGCNDATKTDVQRAKKDIINNDNKNLEKVLQGQINILKDDLDAQKQLLKDVEEANVILKEKLEKQVEATKANEVDFEDLADALTTGIGSVGQLAAGNPGGALKTAMEAIKTGAKEYADNKAIATEDIVSSKFDKLTSEIKTSKENNAEANAEIKKDLEKLTTDLAKLDPELNKKVEKIRETNDAAKKDLENRLASATSEDEAQKMVNKFLKDKGLSDDEIKTLTDNFSFDQILMMLGIGGAYGYRKWGKSGSDEKVKKLENMLFGSNDNRLSATTSAPNAFSLSASSTTAPHTNHGQGQQSSSGSPGTSTATGHGGGVPGGGGQQGGGN